MIRFPQKHTSLWFQQHEIAIAFKTSKFSLLDFELIDLNDLGELHDNGEYLKCNQAMLCLLKHTHTQKKIVVGNAHLQWNPELDYIKFAQAYYLVDKTAEYVRMHENKGGSFVDDSPSKVEQSISLLLCGDYNSLPVSSGLSAFHCENIEDSVNSTWTIPTDIAEAKQERYKKINKMYKRKLLLKQMEPIAGKLQSAYTFYQLPAGEKVYN